MTADHIESPRLEAPRIDIRKNARRLELYDGDRLVKSYSIVLGSAPSGKKEIEGDGKTPEGKFYIFTKNPKSKFHLSLGISYPSAEDADRGLEHGLISREEYDSINSSVGNKKAPPQKTKLGGEVYIHGGGTAGDWTEGCIALKNEDIAELFDTVPVGTPVTILP
jgi:murein L,D-transpeptidase YafK